MSPTEFDGLVRTAGDLDRDLEPLAWTGRLSLEWERVLGRSFICRRLLLCDVTPPGVEPELLLDGVAPPGVEPACLLYRFVVGGVLAFSGKRAPKSKKAATW